MKKGSKNEKEVKKLQLLLNKRGANLLANGDFDTKTERAVRAFQSREKLLVDGKVGNNTWGALKSNGSKHLTEGDIIALSQAFNLELAIVRAVYKVEAKGNGFLPDGRVKVLFEPHQFYKHLKLAGMDADKVTKENFDICHPSYKHNKYGTAIQEQDKLQRAIAIHEDSAYMSASYGAFQMMGFNHRVCGYINAKDMFEVYSLNAKSHLQGFFKFTKGTRTRMLQGGEPSEIRKPLIDHFRSKDWPSAAYGYNGKYYYRGKYDEKLEAAYKSFS